MLEDMFEKYEIVNDVGEHIGKIKEVYIDLTTWEVSGLKISPGVVKKSFLVDIGSIKKVDLDEHKMIVGDSFEKKDLPERSTKHLYPYNELQKQDVVDSEGEKVGKIYSLEIPYDKLKTFKVWKLLIRTGIKARRLRISPSEVEEVMEDVNLKNKKESYEDMGNEKEEEEEKKEKK